MKKISIKYVSEGDIDHPVNYIKISIMDGDKVYPCRMQEPMMRWIIRNMKDGDEIQGTEQVFTDPPFIEAIYTKSTVITTRFFRRNLEVTFESKDVRYPGLGGESFIIFVDSDYLSLHDIIELSDNSTQLYLLRKVDYVSDGSYPYEVKLNTNDPNDYCDPALLKFGMVARQFRLT